MKWLLGKYYWGTIEIQHMRKVGKVVRSDSYVNLETITATKAVNKPGSPRVCRRWRLSRGPRDRKPAPRPASEGDARERVGGGGLVVWATREAARACTGLSSGSGESPWRHVSKSGACTAFYFGKKRNHSCLWRNDCSGAGCSWQEMVTVGQGGGSAQTRRGSRLAFWLLSRRGACPRGTLPPAGPTPAHAGLAGLADLYVSVSAFSLYLGSAADATCCPLTSGEAPTDPLAWVSRAPEGLSLPLCCIQLPWDCLPSNTWLSGAKGSHRHVALPVAPSLGVQRQRKERVCMYIHRHT